MAARHPLPALISTSMVREREAFHGATGLSEAKENLRICSLTKLNAIPRSGHSLTMGHPTTKCITLGVCGAREQPL